MPTRRLFFRMLLAAAGALVAQEAAQTIQITGAVKPPLTLTATSLTITRDATR
jgi:hypothetical protein